MNELIDKYLHGTISSDEERELRDILAKYGYDLDEHIGEKQDDDAPDTITSVRMKQAILAAKKPKKTLSTWFQQPIVRIAATLLILGTLSFFSYRYATLSDNKQWIVKENTGQNLLEFTFPDSTKIWLNTHSQIAYRKDFNQHDRQIRLQGEAYFDVKKDPSKPFIVTAENMKITVLGTSFLVRSNQEDPKRTVSVVSGRVEVALASSNEPSRILHRGDQLGYHQDHPDVIEQQHIDHVDDWKEWRTGNLIFRDESLHTVAQALSRRYNVHISFADERLQNEKITLKIRNEPLETVLNVLKRVSDIDFEIQDNTIQIRKLNY